MALSRQKRTNMAAKVECRMQEFYDCDWMTIGNVFFRLKEIDVELRSLHDQMAADEDDHRDGSEIYGYDMNLDDYLGQLSYISDKWGTAARLAWVVGMLDREEEICQDVLLREITERAEAENSTRSLKEAKQALTKRKAHQRNRWRAKVCQK